MAQFPHDQFISELIILLKHYPEYAEILEPLIVELKQGKIDKIRYLLQQDPDW